MKNADRTLRNILKFLTIFAAMVGISTVLIHAEAAVPLESAATLAFQVGLIKAMTVTCLDRLWTE